MTITPDLIDRLLADLLTLKAALTDDPAPTEAPVGVDDLVDTSTAVERFGMTPDTLRWLCREKGLGEKRGGRWMVRLSALDAYKREKRE